MREVQSADRSTILLRAIPSTTPDPLQRARVEECHGVSFASLLRKQVHGSRNSFVKSRVCWVRKECLTRAPIMMHTRSPFEQKTPDFIGLWKDCG